MERSLKGGITLSDVAKHAGVSLATASRVLNGSDRRVREDLHQKVVASAAMLNYAPNAHAQAMARGRTNVVGLVVHDIADPYFSTIAAGVMEAAVERGLLVTLGSTDRSPEQELELVATFRSQRVQSVILAGSRRTSATRRDPLARELAAFEEGGGRTVLISQAHLAADTIVLQNHQGAHQLATELVGLGYRSHAVLAGPEDLLTARDRSTGYLQAVESSGLRVSQDHLVHGPFTRDGGYDAMLRLLESGAVVDCVFAVNDVMAVGAMAAMRDTGHTPGRDIGVAGFDDISMLRDVAPALTTVRIPLREVGNVALQMAVSDPEPDYRIHTIEGEVVIRDSTPGVQPA